ncbi:hypothetical protein DFH09DRAFT_1333954 [Mycena vulgaris]|nr:hypothetical protein DFH09DRAFT_1333954 [Mycena vulgaris]
MYIGAPSFFVEDAGILITCSLFYLLLLSSYPICLLTYSTEQPARCTYTRSSWATSSACGVPLLPLYLTPRAAGREAGGGGRERDGGWDEADLGTPCTFEAAERVVVVRLAPRILLILCISTCSRTTHTTSALHGRLLVFLGPAPGGAAPGGTPATPLESWGRTLGGFFPRSAPAAAAGSLSGTISTALSGVGVGGSGIGIGPEGGGADAWVRVVDLGPVYRGDPGGGGGVRDVHAFRVGARRGCAPVREGRDEAVPRAQGRAGRGRVGRGIRPSPLSSSASSSTAAGTLAPSGASADTLAALTQLHELRRGRTGAVVQGVAGARDGRFVTLATRRRAVHVFAVNPYGGRVDVRSHVGARVRDGEGAAEGGGAHGQNGGEAEAAPLAPLAMAFVPPAHTPGPASPVSPDTHFTNGSGNNNAHTGARGVQDVFVFDPADGVLSLRRVTLALEAAHEPAGLPPSISVSLPAAGRRVLGTNISASPTVYAVSHAGAAAAGVDAGSRKRTLQRAPRPPALHLPLSKFTFHTLGEDYHALIRRYRFAKMHVRREVEVSAFATGGGASSRASPRPPLRARSCAAAAPHRPLTSRSPVHSRGHIRAPATCAADTAQRLARVVPQSDACAWGCGFGRRRHGGAAAAAARDAAPAPDAARALAICACPRKRRGGGGVDVEASVPLEFDEEDEDFVLPPSAEVDEMFLPVHADRDDDALSATTSRNGDEERMDGVGAADGADGEVWHRWASEDKLAVEEAERFDDIRGRVIGREAGCDACAVGGGASPGRGYFRCA